MSHTHWHIAAVAHLDTDGAEQVLIGLLSEPEYLPDAAAEMARDYVPKPKETFGQTVPYDLIWAAREGRAPSPSNESRRTRFAAALNAEIQRLRSGDHDGQPAALKVLAKALAAVDGRGSAATVLDIVAVPGRWDHFTRLETAELLLLAGVILPASTTLALVDSLIERAENWMQESDNHLLCRALALCPFVDDPLIGFTKVRDVLNKRPLPGYDLRGLVTALGQSRSDAAVDLLYYLASDAATFAHCADRFIEAVAALDTPRSRDLLLHFVDPDIRTFKLTHRLDRENLLVAHIAEIAGNSPEVAARLRELCERDLPELDRYILSKVMSWLGTSEALAANLNLIDDAMPSPVPQGIWDQLENAVVERRPYGQSTNVFTQHARASNDLRAWLFRIAVEDRKRQKSAFMLLGRIEVWRLEHGRPIGEPRHPDLASGNPWPPKDPDLSP